MPPTSLSLKQRLAALSLAPSAPSSPISADSPIKSPRRFGFATPWSKRQPENSFVGERFDGRDLVQEVMARMLFQAGVDFE
jgi:Rho GTPase-activating protein 1